MSLVEFLHWQKIWPYTFNNVSADTFQHFCGGTNWNSSGFCLIEVADSQETHLEYLKINFTNPFHALLVCYLLLQLLEVMLFVGDTETKGTREWLKPATIGCI